MKNYFAIGCVFALMGGSIQAELSHKSRLALRTFLEKKVQEKPDTIKTAVVETSEPKEYSEVDRSYLENLSTKLLQGTVTLSEVQKESDIDLEVLKELANFMQQPEQIQKIKTMQVDESAFSYQGIVDAMSSAFQTCKVKAIEQFQSMCSYLKSYAPTGIQNYFPDWEKVKADPTVQDVVGLTKDLVNSEIALHLFKQFFPKTAALNDLYHTNPASAAAVLAAGLITKTGGIKSKQYWIAQAVSAGMIYFGPKLVSSGWKQTKEFRNSIDTMAQAQLKILLGRDPNSKERINPETISNGGLKELQKLIGYVRGSAAEQKANKVHKELLALAAKQDPNSSLARLQRIGTATLGAISTLWPWGKKQEETSQGETPEGASEPIPAEDIDPVLAEAVTELSQ